MSFHFISFHFMSFIHSFISCHVMSFHFIHSFISFHFISFISFYFISFRFVSFHVIHSCMHAVEWLYDCCHVLLPCSRYMRVCDMAPENALYKATSRFLTAATACVILPSFAAESRESYWSGCIKVAILICQQIFSTLALMIFLLRFL
jgi:hypothetical protein